MKDQTFLRLLKFDLFAVIVEDIMLYILTMVSSNDDHLIHVVAFGTFMLFAHIHMVTHLSAYRNAKIKLTDQERRNYSMRLFFALTHFCVFIISLYLYWRHNAYCEDGIFSLFAFCEYTVIAMNISYHYIDTLDLKDVEYHMVLGSGVVKSQ